MDQHRLQMRKVRIKSAMFHSEVLQLHTTYIIKCNYGCKCILLHFSNCWSFCRVYNICQNLNNWWFCKLCKQNAKVKKILLIICFLDMNIARIYFSIICVIVDCQNVVRGIHNISTVSEELVYCLHSSEMWQLNKDL